MPGIPFVGQWELIALVLVIALIFGPKQVPRLARSLGGGIREVRQVATLEPPPAEARRPEAPPHRDVDAG